MKTRSVPAPLHLHTFVQHALMVNVRATIHLRLRRSITTGVSQHSPDLSALHHLVAASRSTSANCWLDFPQTSCLPFWLLLTSCHNSNTHLHFPSLTNFTSSFTTFNFVVILPGWFNLSVLPLIYSPSTLR